MTAVPGPLHFKPMKGCLSVGQKLFDAFGLGSLWQGNDGFEGVIRQKLTELGVPDQSIPLAGPGSMTPSADCRRVGIHQTSEVSPEAQGEVMAIRIKRGMGVLSQYEYAQCNGQFARGIFNPFCWQTVTPASKVAPPGAPSGDALTVPPASGEQAQAEVDALINQQLADQKALNAGAVQSSWWDEVTGTIGSVAPSSGTSWLLYGVLGIVGVIALVSVGGGSPRRYGR